MIPTPPKTTQHKSPTDISPIGPQISPTKRFTEQLRTYRDQDLSNIDKSPLGIWNDPNIATSPGAWLVGAKNQQYKNVQTPPSNVRQDLANITQPNPYTDQTQAPTKLIKTDLDLERLELKTRLHLGEVDSTPKLANSNMPIKLANIPNKPLAENPNQQVRQRLTYEDQEITNSKTKDTKQKPAPKTQMIKRSQRENKGKPHPKYGEYDMGRKK